MQNHFIVLLTLLSGSSLFAQKPAGTSQRFQVGVNYSADYAYRTLKNDNGSTFSNTVIDLRDDSEKAKYGFTAGLNVLYTLNKSLELGAGIQYSNKGYYIPSILISTTPDPDFPLQGRMVSNLHYMDVPLKANFILGSGKLRGLAGVGIVANFLVKATGKTNYEYSNGDVVKGKYTNTGDYKRFNLSPMISAGVDYQLNDLFHLRLEPTFRYGILKTVDAPVTMYVWNVGLNASCYFSL